MEAHIHAIIAYLEAHPHVGGIITFLIAMTESLAVIGAVIPGSVTMTAIGALIGGGVLPAVSTILFAVFGAFLGDLISYAVGAYFKEGLRNMWPFKKHPKLLTTGEAFFKKHGGKSVIIGRFAGPARSVVPLIAGLMQMSVFRFIAAALPSACAWAIVFIAPGIVLGALALELPPAVATEFVLIILGLLALIWLMFWLVQLSFKSVARIFDIVVAKLWRYLENHSTLQWITVVLNDPRDPSHHQQLRSVFLAIVCLFLFLLMFWTTTNHNFLSALNEPLFTLLRSLRNRTCDDIFVAATLMGDYHVLYLAAFLILLWFLFKRNFRAAIHWVILIVIGSLIGELIQHNYFYPRPPTSLIDTYNSSFPSQHVLLSVLIFGFLAVLIAGELPPPRRKIPYLIAIFFISMISLSRLYLGAHWLTDVLGSLFLSFTLIAIVAVSYRREKSKAIAPISLSIASAIIILACWFGYGVPHFRQTMYDYMPFWPSATLNSEEWWSQRTNEIPLYVISRLGKPNQVLNVQWLDSLDNIKNTLISQGWQEHTPKLNLKTTIQQLSAKDHTHHVPILPTLYHNEAPVLLLTKMLPNGQQLIFELWKSNIKISDSDKQLWLGSISYYIASHKLLSLSQHAHSRHIFSGATYELNPYLQNYDSKVFILEPYQQPTVMLPLLWDGHLLLIRPKNKGV